jgi:methionyl-tRNA formyltransferase
LRVAFFGLPLAALLLQRDGHTIVHAAISRADGLGLRRLRRTGVPVRVQPDAASLASKLRALEPDLVVSWFWTRRLPVDVLGLAPKGAVGVHPSLLPRHRGPDPYFWTIDAGDAVTGVTAHRLDEAYDTGPILGQRSLTVDPAWSAWTLARRLDRPSLSLLREIVGRIGRGETLEEHPQDETAATLAPEPLEEDLALVWDQPAARVVRRVRAASPWPGAFTEIGDVPVAVTRAEVVRAPRALEPGEAAIVDGVGVVRASDGGVALLEGRLEEDERPLDTEGFAALIRRAQSGLCPAVSLE